MSSVKGGKKRRRPNSPAATAGRQAGDQLEAAAPAPGARSNGVTEPDAHGPWYRSTFVLAALSSLLLWAAFPPLGLWPLAWAAPLGWLVLIRLEKLPGGRPYLALWAAGFLHWLVLLQAMRLPHWALYFGWAALTFYLAFYLPVFVALTRIGVHQLRMPIMLAAPAVWTGLELARGHLLTGLSIALLGHTQVGWTSLIQISDVAGAYGVSFLVMFAAACTARMLPLKRLWKDRGANGAVWPVLPLAAAMGSVLVYGQYRLAEPTASESDDRVARVALIQGSIDVVFEYNPERNLESFLQYRDLSLLARKEHPDLDLIVWPESMFTGNEPYFVYGREIQPPPGMPIDADRFREVVLAHAENFRRKTQFTAQSVNTPPTGEQRDRLNIHLLAGTETVELGRYEPRRYNSAILVTPGGDVAGRYDKMHRVMFGEYVPLGDWLPWVYRLTPMDHGLAEGEKPEVFEVAGLRMAPSICFESTVPHLIRRQVAKLTQQGNSPDVLVNVTNDGWFWGSNILDLHLACGVFRAVENRRPLLIAANTGFSAWIDGNGVVLERGPRRANGVIRAEARPDGRKSWYQRYGDLPAGACLAFCLALALLGWGKYGWRRLGFEKISRGR